MTEQELVARVAYCGLVCAVCSHAREGCRGCRSGGGAADCYQRKCCTKNGRDGCWDCENFPCDKGFFGDSAWKGLCTGCVQSIKDYGIGTFLSLVNSTFGEIVDYGEYRFRDPEEIKMILCEGQRRH